MKEWFDMHPCPVGANLTPETASTYLQHVSQASTAVGLGAYNGNINDGNLTGMDGPLI